MARGDGEMNSKMTRKIMLQALDCFLLNNPVDYNYRVKEQKHLIADSEFLTRFSLHLKFDQNFWGKFDEFLAQLGYQSGKIEINAMDVPLISLKKMALLKYSAQDQYSAPLPTLRRQDSMHKVASYFNFMAETILPNDMASSIYEFQDIVKSIICAIPDKILTRQISFVQHYRHKYKPYELLVQLMSKELVKYGITVSDLRCVLNANRKDLIDIFQLVLPMFQYHNLNVLTIYPPLIIRDFCKLKGLRDLKNTMVSFLHEYRQYLCWFKNILELPNHNKRELIIGLLNHFSEFFYLWVSLPYRNNIEHYVVKIEYLEPGRRYPQDNPSSAMIFPKKISATTQQHLSAPIVCRKIVRITDKIFTSHFVHTVHKVHTKSRAILKGVWQTIASIFNNAVGRVWYFPVSRMGGTKCFHYEITTGDPTLKIEDYGLYDVENSDFHSAAEIFGVTESSKEHLHMYTTQERFAIDGKLSQHLIDWHLWLRIKLDNLRIGFYASILLAEFYIFFTKFRDINSWYLKKCTPDWSRDLTTVVPLLTVAATLTLLYRASLIAESIIMKWRVCIVGGLILYIANCLLHLLVIETEVMPILSVWSTRATLIIFIWLILYEFSVDVISSRCSKVTIYLILYLILSIGLALAFLANSLCIWMLNDETIVSMILTNTGM